MEFVDTSIAVYSNFNSLVKIVKEANGGNNGKHQKKRKFGKAPFAGYEINRFFPLFWNDKANGEDSKNGKKTDEIVFFPTLPNFYRVCFWQFSDLVA